MSQLSIEVTCELLRALVKVDEDETPHDAFYEAWDGHREEAGPFNQVLTDSTSAASSKPGRRASGSTNSGTTARWSPLSWSSRESPRQGGRSSTTSADSRSTSPRDGRHRRQSLARASTSWGCRCPSRDGVQVASPKTCVVSANGEVPDFVLK